jgi:hypothetical protein
VFVLETDCGVATIELALDTLFGGTVVCMLVTELGRDAKENPSSCDLPADLVDTEESMEGVLKDLTLGSGGSR